eukprot:9468573-Heterocapsa_arctica.AAC.1
MEHPAEPSWAPSAPSSWQLPEVILLIDELGGHKQYIDQCMCGAPHKKPTELLAVGLPSLPRRIAELAAGGICDKSHVHVTLAGTNDDG